MAVKAIIFDCFDVLIMTGREALLNDFPEKAKEAKDLSLQSDYGYISREEYSRLAAELTGLTPEEFQARYWLTKVRNQSAFAWIKELRASGNYKVGLLSNISRWRMDDFISPSERAELFDAVVLSGEEGMVKPSPEIFELAAQRLGVEPEECVMVDDLLVNVDGAEHVGMKTILFTITSQAQADFNTIIEQVNA